MMLSIKWVWREPPEKQNEEKGDVIETKAE